MKKEKIELPKELVDKLRKKAKEIGFESVEEYIELILTEFVEEESTGFEEEDEEKIKKRLKALGYL